jgi:hypothetical protein
MFERKKKYLIEGQKKAIVKTTAVVKIFSNENRINRFYKYAAKKFFLVFLTAIEWMNGVKY